MLPIVAAGSRRLSEEPRGEGRGMPGRGTRGKLLGGEWLSRVWTGPWPASNEDFGQIPSFNDVDRYRIDRYRTCVNSSNI
jgi:hypothetical protein